METGVYYSPDVAVDINRPYNLVYYSSEDNRLRGYIYEPRTYAEYASLYGEYNASIWFLRKQGVERGNITDPFICEKIADSLYDLSLGIRGFIHEGGWAA